MPTFAELKEKSHVAVHPLFEHWDQRVKKMRTSMQMRAQTGLDLLDIFSQVKQVGIKAGDRTLNAFIQEGVFAAQAALDVFDWPLPPKISYNNVKNVRHARHDESQVVDAEILFNVRISMVSGALRQAMLPVTVASGEIVPPSTLLFEDRTYILGQSTINSIVNRNTSFYLEPLRTQYAGPLRNEELDTAVEQRNEQGYRAREFSGQNVLTRSLARRRADNIFRSGGDTEWLDQQLDQLRPLAEESGNVKALAHILESQRSGQQEDWGSAYMNLQAAVAVLEAAGFSFRSRRRADERAPRNYRCTVCGNEQPITTNHEGNLFDYCKECSWKPSMGPSMNYGGRAFREFEFAGEPGETYEWESDREARRQTAAKYYILAVQWEKGEGWGVEFGSYDRDEVEQENDDVKDSENPAASKVVAVADDSQESIDAAVAKLARRRANGPDFEGPDDLVLRWNPTLKKFTVDRIEQRKLLEQLQEEAGIQVGGAVADKDYDALLQAAGDRGLGITTSDSRFDLEAHRQAGFDDELFEETEDGLPEVQEYWKRKLEDETSMGEMKTSPAAPPALEDTRPDWQRNLEEPMSESGLALVQEWRQQRGPGESFEDFRIRYHGGHYRGGIRRRAMSWSDWSEMAADVLHWIETDDVDRLDEWVLDEGAKAQLKEVAERVIQQCSDEAEEYSPNDFELVMRVWGSATGGTLPGEKARRQAVDFEGDDWSVPGSSMEENSDGLLEQKDHDPRKVDKEYKREFPGEKSRKKDKDRQEGDAQKQKNEKKKEEHSGKDSRRRAWWGEALGEPLNPTITEETPMGTTPATHLYEGAEGEWGGFLNEATQQVFDYIMSEPTTYQRVQALAGQSLDSGMFAKQMQAEPGLGSVYAGQTGVRDPATEAAGYFENVTQMGDVDWNALADQLLSGDALLQPGLVSSKSPIAQATQPAVPSAMGGEGLATDPTILYAEDTQAQLPSATGVNPYEGTGDPTSDLYKQIMQQPQILEMVRYAIQEPYIENQVQVMYDAVLPLAQNIGADPNQVDWYGLTNDLIAYVGFDVQEVSARKVAQIVGRYFMRAKTAEDYSWVTPDMFDEALASMIDSDEGPGNFMMGDVYAIVAEELNDEVLNQLPEGEWDDGDAFDRVLLDLVGRMSGETFLQIPGVYEELSESQNNYVLEMLEHTKNRVIGMKHAQQKDDVKPGEVEDLELQKFLPPGYDVVLGDMVEAEEQGMDSFPRAYAHVEKNYILRRVHTCSKDQWFNHLLNDGFILNPYGPNRGRMGNPEGKQKTSKRAQGESLFDSLEDHESLIPTKPVRTKAPHYFEEGEWGNEPILDAENQPTEKVRMQPTRRIVDLSKEHETSKRAQAVEQGHYLDFKKENGNLHMIPTPEGIEFAQECLAGEDEGGDRDILEMWEDFLTSGWEFVQPEEIGALTDSFILSDEAERDDMGDLTDVGRVYWHPNYMVEFELDNWAEGKPVIFEGVE